MKRFTFKLEAIRTMREQAESVAGQELADELTLLAARAAALEEARVRLERAARASEAALAGSSRPAELRGHQTFVERRERELAVARDQAIAEAEAAARRARLLEATRQRRMIENLRERRRQEKAPAAARAEVSTLAEIAVLAHRRGQDAA
jgi:flagellar FliJ protein